MIKNYVDAEDTDFFKDVIFDNLKKNVCEEDDLFDNLLTFDDLLSMSEDIAPDFWSNPDIDLDALSRALKGVEQDTTAGILEMLPKKKQAMFTPIEKPMKKKDVMSARKEIVGIATAMTTNGELRIEDILSGADDEMID